MALTTKSKPSQKRKAESAFADSDSKNAPPVTKKISSTKLINKKFARPVELLNDVELAEIRQPDLLAYTIALTKQLKAKPMTSSPASELTPQVGSLLTILHWREDCRGQRARSTQLNLKHSHTDYLRSY